jgi:threonine dehydrogenase-like Zn-dependent dehydrogenase
MPELPMGMRVFALAPHGDVHVLPSASLRAIGSNVPATRAVLAANLETALTCVWDSRASVGDRVVVIGGGIVGLLVAWLSRRVGAEVSIVEPHPARRIAAGVLGVSILEEFDTAQAEGVADVVIEASGNPAALQLAMSLAGFEARIVVVSNYGIRTHELDLCHDFHRRRLTLVSSQVSELPADRRARWTTARRFDIVQRLLEEPLLDQLISPVVPFDEAPQIYARLGSSDWLQVVFKYS